MTSIGERIQEAIEHMEQGETTQALASACIALDATVQRQTDCVLKRFVHDHLWLITYIGFPGLTVSTIKVPFSHPGMKSDTSDFVGIEDIVLHVIQCSLNHTGERESKITWNDKAALGLDPEGNLILNSGLIWSLISTVIFSPCNKMEFIAEHYWLQVGEFRMFISELWGRMDIAERIVKFYTGIDAL